MPQGPNPVLTDFIVGAKNAENLSVTSASGQTTVQPNKRSDALQIQTADTPGGASPDLFLFSGAPGGSGKSGDANYGTGNNPGSGDTGTAWLYSGDSSGGNSGDVHLLTGAAGGTRGSVVIDALITRITNGQLQAPAGVEFDIASPGNGGASNTGSVFVFSGDQSGTGQSGTVGLQSGNAAAENSGPCFVGTGNSSGANSAATTVFTGDGHNTGIIQFGTGNASAGNSGDILIGTGTATGTKGNIITPGLPTADPHVVGAWWVDVAGGRVLKVSNG